ncbi:CMRF35-like molecule 6 isoform X2 [Pelodiscus sinensis]|uniref:CMRF35-like molecule 6 isoform X2 n=1 Tax=Pelodiscus sinensis TaxID=13735 RepID=UPI003F6AA268
METQMLQTLTPCLSFQTLKHHPLSGHWGHGIAAGSRKGAHVSLSLSLAGCWAVTGPGSVRGRPGGSVTVECGYEKGYEDYSKFWCREGIWRETRLCSDGHLVETTERETEVTRGRFSIRDNRTQRVFTVTVENLTLADAGKYQCGVERALLQTDLRHTVSVSVSPDVSPRSPITDVPPQSPTIETLQITKQPDSPSPTTTESTFSASADTTPTRFTILILLLGLSKGLVFLGIVCAATWGSVRDRKSRREMVSRRTRIHLLQLHK